MNFKVDRTRLRRREVSGKNLTGSHDFQQTIRVKTLGSLLQKKMSTRKDGQVMLFAGIKRASNITRKNDKARI